MTVLRFAAPLAALLCAASPATLHAASAKSLAKPLAQPPALAPVTSVQGFAAIPPRVAGALGANIALPKSLPAHKGPLFAYDDPSQDTKTSVFIAFDPSADCHGAHYCTIGSLQISKAAPEMEKDHKGRVITRKIGPATWFTPEHAMGDDFPAQIVWVSNGWTYNFAWADVSPKAAQRTLDAVRRSATP